MSSFIRRPMPVSQLRAWGNADRLYAVIDACDQPEVPRMAEARGQDWIRSLYQGRADENLWAIAPYLARVDDEMFDWISDVLWPEPWGIFVASSDTIDGLYAHLRRFLVVESPGGEPWYFRYYDPRVLPKFLASATESELDRFYGTVVSAFGVGAGPDTVTVFSYSPPAAAAPVRLTAR